MHKPGESHWQAARKILRYLAGSLTKGIVLGGQTMKLTGWADAGFATVPADCHSILGYVIMLGDGPVAWQSVKSKSVNLSSSEAEQYALGDVTRELLWMKILFDELLVIVTPIEVYEDNRNVIQWVRDKAIRARTRHIGVQLNFVRESEKSGIIKLLWVSGQNQIADIFTKPLAGPLFHKFAALMGIASH